MSVEDIWDKALADIKTMGGFNDWVKCCLCLKVSAGGGCGDTACAECPLDGYSRNEESQNFGNNLALRLRGLRNKLSTLVVGDAVAFRQNLTILGKDRYGRPAIVVEISAGLCKIVFDYDGHCHTCPENALEKI